MVARVPARLSGCTTSKSRSQRQWQPPHLLHYACCKRPRTLRQANASRKPALLPINVPQKNTCMDAVVVIMVMCLRIMAPRGLAIMPMRSCHHGAMRSSHHGLCQLPPGEHPAIQHHVRSWKIRARQCFHHILLVRLEVVPRFP